MSELVRRNKQNRNAILGHLYEASEGNIFERVDLSKFGEALGLTAIQISQIMTFLVEGGFAKGDGAGDLSLRITRQGILEAESILSTPEFSMEAQLVDTITVKKHRLFQHQTNREKLKLQAAKYGSLSIPLHLMNQIEDEENEIARLEAEIENFSKSG